MRFISVEEPKSGTHILNLEEIVEIRTEKRAGRNGDKQVICYELTNGKGVIEEFDNVKNMMGRFLSLIDLLCADDRKLMELEDKEREKIGIKA